MPDMPDQEPESGPLCFVAMPFGRKADAAGLLIDFDAVYRDLIRPAIVQAGMRPIRADEELEGGIIHKPMFERLVLCEYAVADLTTANANVFYELGVRHAARPWATVPVFASCSRLPFDVAMLRAVPYSVSEEGVPTDLEEARDLLSNRLQAAMSEPTNDSPVHQLLEGYPDIDHTKTDVFRDRVRIATELKERLAQARKEGAEAVHAVEESLGGLTDQDTGVLIDLMLSYRAVEQWDSMIQLVERLPLPVAQTVLVREQLAFALNRAGRGEEAERVLLDLIERRGPSSETYGLLGRVYKDRWEAAVQRGDEAAARGLLKRAIDAYRRGFEADWRDAYPGINAATLMELREPADPARERLIPVVRYAAERRVASGKADYWDHATLLEAAVLERNAAVAGEALADALAAIRERWEPRTTARNLRLIREAREKRGEEVPWAEKLEQELQDAAGGT